MGVDPTDRKVRTGARALLPVLFFLIAVPVRGADLYIEGPCSGEPWTDGEFTLWVDSPDLLGTAAYRADIVFDPSIFQVLFYQRPMDGPFAPGPSAGNAPAQGTLSVAGLSCGSFPPQRGRILLGRLRLRIVGSPGSSTEISLGEPVVLNEAGVRLPLETNSLPFEVVSTPDRDCDDVSDAADNCPAVYNPDQIDGDEDGVGDRCIGLSVALVAFTAQARDRAVVLRWETSSESGTAGFHLYRSVSAGGPWLRLTPGLIPSKGNGASGGTYEYVDRPPRRPGRIYYILQDVSTSGIASSHPPVRVTIGKPGARGRGWSLSAADPGAGGGGP